MCPHDPLPDSIGGRYRVVSQVGTGGMGIVYKATDTKLNRPVAIKAIHSHRVGDRRGRLRAEALAAASIDHPYLCKVYEFVEEGEEAFLVMEFVEGETLSTILARGVPPIADSLAIVSEILQGLAAAHGHGLVHRDVKPSNVMLTSNGHVKLLDFGLARADAIITPAESTRTSPADGGGDHAGTPHYMAPEQAMGRPVTSRSDLFSVGALLYECLTGHLPFAGSSGYDYVRHMLSDDPRPIARVAPKVPVDLARLVYRCLEKTPANRPESADELLGEVRRIADAMSHSDAGLPTAGAVRTRQRVRWAGLAALAAVAAVVGWQWLATSDTSPVLSQSQPLVTWRSVESESRVSPDGRFVAFLSERGGSPNAYVVPVSGGGETRVRLPAGVPESLMWSPGGDHLAVLLRRAVESTWRVVVVPIFGGPIQQSIEIEPSSFQLRLLRWIDRSIYLQIGPTLQRLHLDTESLTPVSDEWSLAGRLTYVDVSLDGRVAYTLVADGRTDLWTADLDGGRARQLTDDETFERFPVWHASGSAIVYQSNRRGQVDLWEWRLDDDVAVPLTSSQGADTPGGLSADGSVLSFTREMDEADLWMWTSVGDAGRPATADTRRDYAPSLSADGRVAVFQRSRPTAVRGSLFDSTLFVATVTAVGIDEPREVDDGFAAHLSRDGTWLAYLQRSEPGRSTLLVRRLETDEVQTVSVTVPLLSFFSSSNDWSEQNVVWSFTDDTLFFVDETDGRWSVRQYRPGGDLPDQPLAEAGPGETIRDLFPTTDGSALAYLVHSDDDAATRLLRIDLRTGRALDLARLEVTDRRAVVGRGWLADDHTFVLLRQGTRHEDGSRDIDVLLVTGPDQVRTATVLNRAFVGTVRLDDAAGVLYVAADEVGVRNMYAVSLSSSDRRLVTTNTLEGVMFSAPALDQSGRMLGVQHRLTRDIWIIDARPQSGIADGSTR